MNKWSYLPAEIWYIVFARLLPLNPQTLSLTLVCKNWHRYLYSSITNLGPIHLSVFKRINLNLFDRLSKLILDLQFKDVTQKRVTQILKQLPFLSTLKIFNIRKHIHSSLSSLPLTCLSITHNNSSRSTSIPQVFNMEFITRFNNNNRLSSLSLNGNMFIQSSIPTGLSILTHLQKLKLKQNQISTVQNFERLLTTTLTTLNLSSNRITEIDNSITVLRNLTRLVMSYNRIQVLPDQICSLLQLRELNVAFNQINTLPYNIGNCLTNLTVLTVNDNDLDSLPDSIVFLLQLKVIDVSFNCFEGDPIQLDALRVFARVYNET